MSQTNATSQSTWRSKIKAMGPGILMASAAVGGFPHRFINSSGWFLWMGLVRLGYSCQPL